MRSVVHAPSRNTLSPQVPCCPLVTSLDQGYYCAVHVRIPRNTCPECESEIMCVLEDEGTMGRGVSGECERDGGCESALVRPASPTRLVSNHARERLRCCDRRLRGTTYTRRALWLHRQQMLWYARRILADLTTWPGIYAVMLRSQSRRRLREY